MKINHVSSSYSVFEQRKGTYWLVKVIGEHSTAKEAYSDMVSIFNNRKSEEEDESEYSKKRLDALE